MPNQAYNPGDVEVKYIAISNNPTNFDSGTFANDDWNPFNDRNYMVISDLVMEISIVECIFYPVITGHIIILDSIDVLNEFPLTAHETQIVIGITVPGNADFGLREFNCYLTKIKTQETGGQATYGVYAIEFASKEIINNANSLAVTTYKNDTVNSYIEKILRNEIKTNKRLFVNNEFNKTKATPNFDNLLMKPFQAINLMCKNAVSSNPNSSNLFLFYENKYGFNFFPADILISSNTFYSDRRNPYLYRGDRRPDLTEVFYDDILHYDHLSYKNPASLMSKGVFHNKTTSFDLRTRSYNPVTYKFFDEKTNNPSVKIGSDSDQSLDIVSRRFFGSQGSKQIPAKTFNCVKTSNEHNTKEKYLEDKLGRSSAYLEMLTNNMIHLTTWGDTRLTAGYRIKIEIPNTTYGNAIKGYEAKTVSNLAGEYLISSLNHLIRREKSTFRYYNGIEIVTPSFNKGNRG